MKPQYAVVQGTLPSGITTLVIVLTGKTIQRILPVNVKPGQILLGIW